MARVWRRVRRSVFDAAVLSYASLRVNLLDVDVGKLFHFRFSSFKARTNRKSGTNRKLLDAAAWLRRGLLLLAGGEDVLDRRVDFAREERS